MDKHGAVHRGPMTYSQAEAWLNIWNTYNAPGEYYIARRLVGDWKPIVTIY